MGAVIYECWKMWKFVKILSNWFSRGLKNSAKKSCKKMLKKVQKNLEVIKKCVPLQPVWEITESSLTSLRKDNEVKLEEK